MEHPTTTENPIKAWRNRGNHAYPAIHLFVILSLIFSWIVLVAGGITGLVLFIAGIFEGHGLVSFFVMLLSWALSILWWIWFRVLPELLQIVLRIEEHLRTLRNAGSPE